MYDITVFSEIKEFFTNIGPWPFVFAPIETGLVWFILKQWKDVKKSVAEAREYEKHTGMSWDDRFKMVEYINRLNAGEKLSDEETKELNRNIEADCKYCDWKRIKDTYYS